jgi:hypothetical protein
MLRVASRAPAAQRAMFICCRDAAPAPLFEYADYAAYFSLFCWFFDFATLADVSMMLYFHYYFRHFDAAIFDYCFSFQLSYAA